MSEFAQRPGTGQAPHQHEPQHECDGPHGAERAAAEGGTSGWTAQPAAPDRPRLPGQGQQPGEPHLPGQSPPAGSRPAPHGHPHPGAPPAAPQDAQPPGGGPGPAWAEGGPDEEQAVGPWESAAVQEAPDEGQETPDDGPRPLGVGLRPTGHAPVDGHLRRLEDADHLAVSAHQEVYEDVHRGLRETLAALDRPHTPRS